MNWPLYCRFLTTMDIAVRFDFAPPRIASLKLGLRSSHAARQRSSGGVALWRTRWGGVDTRRLVVRAAEEAEADTRVRKRESRSFSECVLLLGLEEFVNDHIQVFNKALQGL